MPRPEPTISVVIPCCGSASLLREALLSVEDQTSPADEVIVVDDGSEVPIAPLLQHEFPAVRFLRQTRMGASVARNVATALSTCTWITFLDADDLWHRDRLARLRECILRHPTYDLIGTDYVLVPLHDTGDERVTTDPNSLLVRSALDPLSQIELAPLQQSDFVRHHQFGIAAIVRRETLLAAGGFNALLRGAEDWMLWAAISGFGTTAKLADATYIYRQSAGSSSHSLPMAASGLQGLLTVELHSSFIRGWQDRQQAVLADHLQLVHQVAAWRARSPHRTLRRFTRHLLLQLASNSREAHRIRLIMVGSRIAIAMPFLTSLARKLPLVRQMNSWVHGRETTAGETPL